LITVDGGVTVNNFASSLWLSGYWFRINNVTCQWLVQMWL
jgi:hypothetical protein